MKTIKIDIEVKIKANIKKVWKSLVEETNNWWSKDFYTSPKTKEFILEPIVGGKMYENYGNEEGLIWGNIVGIDSPNSIDMIAHLTPQFGGPAISFLKITLKEEKENTIFKLSDCSFGDINDNSKTQIEVGWRMIYENTFKNYVETKFLRS